MPKLDNVFNLEKSAQGIFHEKDDKSKNVRMPKLQTQHLNKRNQLNRIQPGEIASSFQEVKPTQGGHHLSSSVHSSSLKINSEEVPIEDQPRHHYASCDRPTADGPNDLPWQTDRMELAGKKGQNSNRFLRNFNEIQRSEGARGSQHNQISAAERGIYVDTLEDEEELSESLSSSED